MTLYKSCREDILEVAYFSGTKGRSSLEIHQPLSVITIF
jgi:hypothetical protein